MRIRNGLSPLVLAVALLTIAAVAIAGCGSSSDETTGGGPPASTSGAPQGAGASVCSGAAALKGEVRVTGISCTKGRAVVAGWGGEPKCFSPSGASRYSCKISQMTCLAASVDAGIAVTCARPGQSLAFVARRRGDG
jgi:hypothetical protein